MLERWVFMQDAKVVSARKVLVEAAAAFDGAATSAVALERAAVVFNYAVSRARAAAEGEDNHGGVLTADVREFLFNRRLERAGRPVVETKGKAELCRRLLDAALYPLKGIAGWEVDLRLVSASLLFECRGGEGATGAKEGAAVWTRDLLQSNLSTSSLPTASLN